MQGSDRYRADRRHSESLTRGPGPGARGVIIIVLAMMMSACYYIQAAHGQLSLMMAREPIEDLLSDPDLDPETRAGLERVSLARAFAMEDLGLPDNGSYRHLVRLEGERVAWNVFAAPEFSLEPKQWCVPIAGCMAYRGYFSHRSASRYADRLSEQGWDTHVAPVAAYSTLGRFRDPVLDSMLRWPEPELAGLIFHELAHQQLYQPDATAFNEGFATAVAEIGLQRWMQVHPLDASLLDAYRGRQEREATFNQLLADTRAELGTLYASELDADAMRDEKAAIFARLHARYLVVRDGEWQGYTGYDGWFEGPMNNARLLPVITYRSWDAAFIALYREVGEDIPRFFQAASELAALEPALRQARLEALDRSVGDASD